MLIATLTVLLAVQNLPLVERARVGPVSIGAAAEPIAREFGDRARLIDMHLEGQFSPAFEIRLFGAQAGASLIAEISPSNNQLVVTRIRVLDPRLRTKEGIGIGSTYADLRSRYSVDWVASGEGDFFARVESLGISFMLDMSGEQKARTGRNAALVPGDVRVVGMLLTR
jgi:hypothetical protein